MSIARPSTMWSGKVIAVGDPGTIMRGRTAEFRHRGVSVSIHEHALRALIEVGREPTSVVLVPTNLIDMPVLDFVDLVRTLTSAPVLLGLVKDCDLALLPELMEHGVVGSVTLPVTPVRLAQAALAAHPPAPPKPSVITCGALHLDEAQHRVQWHGEEVRLSRKEFAMLRRLMASHPSVVTLNELVGEFEHGDPERTMRVRVAVRRIRLKLQAAVPHAPAPFETLYQVGYRITA